MHKPDGIAMFMPIELIKGKEITVKGKKRTMLFKGIASNMKTGADMDGEILDPNGFDFAHLLKSGHINWNHQAGRDPLAIVGEPTSAKVVDDQFHIEGFLYEDSVLAQKIYKAAEMLEKSGSTRRLGFSVEGNAIERDPANKKLIKKASIMNVAIAPTPKNAGTSMELVKGLQYDAVDSVGTDMIVDVTSGNDRVLINKAFDIEVVNASDTVLTVDAFNKAVQAVAKASADGEITDKHDIIKSHLSTFRPILKGTLYVGGTAN